jgi:hypothetical protein
MTPRKAKSDRESTRTWSKGGPPTAPNDAEKADSNGEDAVFPVKLDAVALTSAAPEHDNDGGDGTVDHEMRRDAVQGLTGERSQTVQDVQDAEEQVEQDFQAVTQNHRQPSELAVQNLEWVPLVLFLKVTIVCAFSRRTTSRMSYGRPGNWTLGTCLVLCSAGSWSKLT